MHVAMPALVSKLLAVPPVPALFLQTPWLTGTRKWGWQRLSSQGWIQALQSLGLALLDSLAALLRLPAKLRVTMPLAGLPGSSALLQLQQHELDAHHAALSSSEAPVSCVAAVKLCGGELFALLVAMSTQQHELDAHHTALSLSDGRVSCGHAGYARSSR